MTNKPIRIHVGGTRMTTAALIILTATIIIAYLGSL